MKGSDYERVIIKFVFYFIKNGGFSFNRQFIIGIVKGGFLESCLVISFFCVCVLNRILFHHISLGSTNTLFVKFKLNNFNSIVNDNNTSAAYKC